MPNMKGGKHYKKTKHHQEVPQFVEKSDDQLYGRVITMLGNRNVSIFCEDNIIRLCHIRGSIKKDTWIRQGDVVLISCREFLKDEKRGDLLMRYDRDFYSKLKKKDNFNMKLFLSLESMTSEELERVRGSTVEVSTSEHKILDDIFEESEKEDEIDIDAI